MLLWHSFIVMVQSLFAHTPQLHKYMAQFPLLPFASPLYPLPLTWHPPVVIGIVHLPLRLLVNWPHLLPFTQLTHPSQIPGIPPAPHLTTTTSGIFWLLVSRTIIIITVSDCVKPISQCRHRRACIWNGEPLGKGKREWGGRGGVSIQPTWDQSGRGFTPRHRGGISK